MLPTIMHISFIGVNGRRRAEFLFKRSADLQGIGITDTDSDIADWVFSDLQQFARSFHPILDNEVDWTKARVFVKIVGEAFGIHRMRLR